jgi:hypothetical protein
LEKHSIGGLINPDTLARFNQAKNFKVIKNFTFACEFFKHLGHFIDEDLKVFMQHLLGKTPDQMCPYPKVIVHKTSKLHRTHYSATEWVEHRKKKLIVLQELDELDGSLEFITIEGTGTTRSGGHGSSFTTFQQRPGTSCFPKFRRPTSRSALRMKES